MLIVFTIKTVSNKYLWVAWDLEHLRPAPQMFSGSVGSLLQVDLVGMCSLCCPEQDWQLWPDSAPLLGMVAKDSPVVMGHHGLNSHCDVMASSIVCPLIFCSSSHSVVVLGWEKKVLGLSPMPISGCIFSLTQASRAVIGCTYIPHCVLWCCCEGVIIVPMCLWCMLWTYLNIVHLWKTWNQNKGDQCLFQMFNPWKVRFNVCLTNWLMLTNSSYDAKILSLWYHYDMTK